MSDSSNIWTNQYNPFQGLKVLAFHGRMKKIPAGNYDAPVNIALDICQGTADKKKCGGFNCSMCMSNWEDVGAESEIPKNVLLNIPRFYKEWGVLSICIAGHNSDPCMYNHNILIDFLRLCNRYNIQVGIATNGAFLTKYLMEEIARTCNWIGFSVNAGGPEDHELITGTKTFKKVMDNMKYLASYVKEYRLLCTVDYKYLITDENYKNIYKGVELASKIGIRHFQIRPCDLPDDRAAKVNVKEVERQLNESLKLERKGEFEVFGIREKFNKDFKKVSPYKCIASPLGSTWMGDGSVVICPDRRWSRHKINMCLGNFVTEGLEAIRRKWGGVEHKKMIDAANADMENCHRCTSIHWHRLYQHTIDNDDMDLTLI